MTQTQKQELYLKLSSKLSGAGRQAEEAAREAPPGALPALDAISKAAREGQGKLKEALKV
jgi:hypothetical protein